MRCRLQVGETGNRAYRSGETARAPVQYLHVVVRGQFDYRGLRPRLVVFWASIFEHRYRSGDREHPRRALVGSDGRHGSHIRISADDDIASSDGSERQHPLRPCKLGQHGRLVHRQHHPGRIRAPIGARPAILLGCGDNGPGGRGPGDLRPRHHSPFREDHVRRTRHNVRRGDLHRL